MKSKEEKLTKQQRYMIGKKQINVSVNEALFEDFKAKLEKDDLTAKEVLEAAIYSYLNDEIIVKEKSGNRKYNKWK